MKRDVQFVIGVSGCGKTFYIRSIATKLSQEGQHAVILAPFWGHEYRLVRRDVGDEYGEYMDAAAGEWKINIVDLIEKEQCSDQTDNETLIAFSEAVMQRELSDLEKEEVVKASKEVISSFRQQKESPVLKDLIDTMRSYPQLSDMVECLQPMADDPECSFFNGQTNIVPTESYTVISLDKLPWKFRKPAFIAASSYLCQYACEHPDTHVFIDGAEYFWDGEKSTIPFFAKMVQEFSQHDCSVVIAMQSLDYRAEKIKGIFGTHWELQLMRSDPAEKQPIESAIGYKVQPEVFELVCSDGCEQGDYVMFYPNGSWKAGKVTATEEEKLISPIKYSKKTK